MALNETVTDIWVSKMFEKEKIEATPQGTNIIDIAEALKSASKNGKGNGGFPDFIAKSKDFILI